ncbi:MAG: N,N-dimethylformamidase beta subunit family domain-containing protein [Pseudomonadota bacterium]
MSDLKITGYVDRWSARPGETLTFFISTAASHYRSSIVRLIHGDPNPSGPGFKVEQIDGLLVGDHEGRLQTIATGSCVVLPGLPPIEDATFFLRFQPTLLPHRSEQCLLSLPVSTGGALGVTLSADGRLNLRRRTSGGQEWDVLSSTDFSLTSGEWYQLVLVVKRGVVDLQLAPRAFALTPAKLSAAFPNEPESKPDEYTTILLGASALDPHHRSWRSSDCFNGKIDTPILFDRALGDEELALLMQRGPDAPVATTAIGAWDFVAESGGTCVPNRLGRRFDGWTLNRPMRLIPGFSFSGDEMNPAHAPAEFNAVHLHEDDLADCGWEPSHRLKIPDGLRSGVYALRLEAEGFFDHIPFAIRPAKGEATAEIAFLMPTVSYQAYANKLLSTDVLPPGVAPLAIDDPQPHFTAYCQQNRIRSLYDCHDDGSGIAMATMRRPMLNNVRPDSRNIFVDGAHELSADLYLLDWLEAKGFAYDVVTDHDLDREGADSLASYRCILSGTHHEYWTGAMLDGLSEYTDNGGRFIYLSGNGLYWVTAISDDGSMIEIRRDHGTRAWSTERGAGHLSLSGEQGGIWAWRGRAPQRFVGVGFAAQGFDKGRPDQRTELSKDPRVSFIFDGIESELIGDFPNLVSAWGAAGFEVDKADPALGTPPHALVVASATGFTDSYQFVVEEAPAMQSLYGGSIFPGVRADMVFYETPNGGAVFSTGSISWCSCLSYNNYDNNVAQLTENVLRRFISPDAFALFDKH